MEVKDKIKISAAQTKILAYYNAASENSDSNTSAKVPRKRKARTGVLSDQKKQVKKTPKHKGYQSYCVMCKKAGINELKYKFT